MVVHSAQYATYTSLFQSVLIIKTTSQEAHFTELFIMPILLAVQGCIQMLSEHKPWLLSRLVIQLRDSSFEWLLDTDSVHLKGRQYSAYIHY